ncbi:MAG: dihydropteroate synthase, partial [Candidatus Dormibacteraeota bacterium]|nr:dihydropteroate synthase [Candidatus Dormibacteraeota bacterium]
FGRRTLVMGVLNVTPDSFSGDGVGDDVTAAVSRAVRLQEEGADVIDVGAESTRPNSAPVDAAEELRRLLPVLRALQGRITVPLSVDTRKAEVAAAALDEGAAILNDVWGLRAEPAIARVAAAHPDCGVVVMHNQRGTGYEDLMADVSRALRESVTVAVEAGIPASQVICDPGFGFAKTPAQNLEVLRRLGELRSLGRPLLVGLSRKSTLGALLGGAAPQDRVEAGIAAATLAVAAGAHMVRTHDVAPTVSSLKLTDAVVREIPSAIRDLPAPGPTG